MKIAFNSPVILIFSFICAVVYLLTSSNIFTDAFVLMPEWDFSNGKWYFRLFSHVLGHSSVSHLMGNLALILLIGPIVEEKYGAKNLIIMMISVALVTSLIHMTLFSHALLGASGIAFMLILLVSLVNLKDKKIPLTFILVLIIYIGGEIMASFEDDNISHSAHIIGGLVGAFFGFRLAGKGKKKESSEDINLMA